MTVPANSDGIQVTLYYQGTSREYIKFLRDEINGTAQTLLTAVSPAGIKNPYIVQLDSFFDGLEAWGDTIWELWRHNHGLDGSGAQVSGIVPFAMAEATWGGTPTPCLAPQPTLVSAVVGNSQVTLTWLTEHDADPSVIGYAIYYDQGGKGQQIARVDPVTEYVDEGLTNGQEYCYKITSLFDQDGDGVENCESDYSVILCATPTAGQTAQTFTIQHLETGRYEVTGKGNNKVTTFVPTTSFSIGQTVVIRVTLLDVNTLEPVSNATASIAISGPEILTLNSSPSKADGVAEASWATQTPNRKGQGGTAAGQYLITVNNVTASGYTWDGAIFSILIELY